MYFFKHKYLLVKEILIKIK